MAKYSSWVAYHDGIEQVKIISRRVNPKHLVRPCENPVLVEEVETKERYVVSLDHVYDNPMDAHRRSAEMAPEGGDTDDDEDEEVGDEDDDDAGDESE